MTLDERAEALVGELEARTLFSEWERQRIRKALHAVMEACARVAGTGVCKGQCCHAYCKGRVDSAQQIRQEVGDEGWITKSATNGGS